jgi:cyanophycinase
MKNAYFLLIFIIFSCQAQEKSSIKPQSVPFTSYLTGDANDVKTQTSGGLLLMGGGSDVTSAMEWFLDKSGGGDIVVIRASGADGYNEYLYKMRKINSIETLIIDSREKAFIEEISQKIKNSEGLFIAGGDQWNYVNFWKDTPIEDAINYLINTKKVPVGGTSAGLAILGQSYFSAKNGSVTADESLKNPMNDKITLGNADFIESSFLKNVITDSHYSERQRQGRHIVFMARMMQDFSIKVTKGIGIDEKTALCIDANGMSKVYGTNDVYFLECTQLPEKMKASEPFVWNKNKEAIKAYKVGGKDEGSGEIDIQKWQFKGGESMFYYIENGELLLIK